MVKRVLVTTALEQTWPKDEPILFLGEWCRLYSCKHVWESLDHKVLPYHWEDRERNYKDYEYLCAAYERYLGILADRLN